MHGFKSAILEKWKNYHSLFDLKYPSRPLFKLSLTHAVSNILLALPTTTYLVPTTTAAGFLLGLNNPELPFGPKLTESNFDHASY
jgi:hypothetical protein